MKRLILTFSVALAVAALWAERQPYDRYQTIVDRQMFGPLPPGFDPTKSPAEVTRSSSSKDEKQLTKEQEKVKSAIRFSMINVTPDGKTAIGFTDNSDPKAPVNYYLKVGEKRNGWEVKEADPEAASMTIVKDGIEVSLSLGGDSAGKDGATQAAGGGARAFGRGSLLSGGMGSLRGRRRMREQQAEAVRAEAAEKAKQEAAEQEARRAEEAAQRAAEREEQRKQLMQIQEELRRVRETKQQTNEKPVEDENPEG